MYTSLYSKLERLKAYFRTPDLQMQSIQEEEKTRREKKKKIRIKLIIGREWDAETEREERASWLDLLIAYVGRADPKQLIRSVVESRKSGFMSFLSNKRLVTLMWSTRGEKSHVNLSKWKKENKRQWEERKKKKKKNRTRRRRRGEVDLR